MGIPILVSRIQNRLQTWLNQDSNIIGTEDYELLLVYIVLFYLLQAVEYFHKALQQSPQTVTYKELGRAYLLIGGLDNAVEVYKKAVK